MLEAILAETKAFTIGDIARAAKVWPSIVLNFVQDERACSQKLFRRVGVTIPSRNGNSYDLYEIVSDEKRNELAMQLKFVRMSENLRMPPHATPDDVVEDLLEPPLGFQAALVFFMRGDPELFSVAKDNVKFGEKNPMRSFDDSARAEHADKLYRSLVSASIALWEKELGLSTDGRPLEKITEDFERAAGKLLLLGKWHANYIALVADRWRKSPLLCMNTHSS
jgi:hypothetical protein